MPKINWGNFIDPEYWLEGIAGSRGTQDGQQPGISLIIQADSWFFWAYLTIFATFVILGILLRASQAFFDEKHPLQKKFPAWSGQLALMGVLGFCWFFFRQINTTFLNSRIFLLFGLIWVIAFLVWVGRYFVKFYPLEILAYKKSKEAVQKK